MKNHYKCPVCGSTEVYREGYTVRLGKYDSPEPGYYYCVDSHQWKVEVEQNQFEEYTVEKIR